MENVTIDLGNRAYQILIKPGILSTASRLLSSFVKNKNCFVISDSNVFTLYGERILNQLKKAGAANVYKYTFPPGEQSKNINTLKAVYDSMAEAGITRDSAVIALGGGVPGDLAGFAAATFMRGIDYIQVPTTLLSMVDSSVGGKTGVDLSAGKNLVGAFWQPKLVLIDTNTLDTLPQRELKSGLAEVIKYGVILDKELFSFIDLNIEKILSTDLSVYEKIISECCKLKGEVVIEDEHEKNLRAVLNFGHTFGHAIEAVTNYEKYTHGEAVAIGMLMAAKTGEMLKCFSPDENRKLYSVISKIGLPVKAEGVCVKEIYNAMFKDKKVKSGKINFIIPEKIGSVQIINIDKVNLIKQCISDYVYERQ
ncbi:MAG: 3-dehydroquinate synthase [Victivallales bacterium]|nr:3-dehydroquinate synthase [Victivallales bacterium]MCF7889523.1 3-dehydroquinate synthase [Victivallales bacterium]